MIVLVPRAYCAHVFFFLSSPDLKLGRSKLRIKRIVLSVRSSAVEDVSQPGGSFDKTPTRSVRPLMCPLGELERQISLRPD